jgi:hypothetical protein
MKNEFMCYSITEKLTEKEIILDVYDHTGTLRTGSISLVVDKSVNEFKVGEHYEVNIKFKNYDRR